MYSNLQLAKKYAGYYTKALNGKGHGMHSPFIYNFILNVLNNAGHYQPPVAIEQTRKKLYLNTDIIEVEDLGAGSRKQQANRRRVNQIARQALKSPKYASLIFRVAKYYQPKTVIELGTSLGITTSYIAKAVPDAKIYTIEGSAQVRQKALTVFNALQINNVESLQGNFDDVLPDLMSRVPEVDMAYIDGNHRDAPTWNYFQHFLDKTHNDSILIFDDIHWSFEMEQVWERIKAHPSVKCTVDIFFLGFVFFRKEFRETQHFTIRF